MELRSTNQFALKQNHNIFFKCMEATTLYASKIQIRFHDMLQLLKLLETYWVSVALRFDGLVTWMLLKLPEAQAPSMAAPRSTDSFVSGKITGRPNIKQEAIFFEKDVIYVKKTNLKF